MGLETVELLIRIEERFQTYIPDWEAEQITTVGELHEFLMQRIKRLSSSSCLTISIFNSIRKVLLQKYFVHRQDIHLDSLLNELVPRNERYDFWQTIVAKLAVNLPDLKRSRIVQWQGDLFPENLSTIRDLCLECLNSYSILNEFKLADREIIWCEVCRIVADVAYVEPEDLFPETSFVRELGF